MEDDDRKLDVTIVRPRTDEIPREVGVGGLQALAKLIARRIRGDGEEAGSEDDALSAEREDA